MSTAAWALWAALGALLVVVQVGALASGGRWPPIGWAVAKVTAVPAGRAVLVVGWMWLGWHAFAR